MKKLINAPDGVLVDALAGVAAAHPSLTVDVEERYITRAGGPTPGKVSLVSGGGSGHEPLHGGFVGYGMLDAACPGEVFTSPVPEQILAATKAVDARAGVLHVVKNYTGDVLNFQMAAELAADDGVRVEAVVVDDDVAVEDSTWTAGRRGTGATVFVEVDHLQVIAKFCLDPASEATSTLVPQAHNRIAGPLVAVTAQRVVVLAAPSREIVAQRIRQL